MSKLRPLLVLPAVLAFVACTSGGSPDPSVSPTVSPSASPSPAPSDGIEIDHATGAGDLVLRMETGGGFAPIGSVATQAPTFSLYGDGTLIARDETAPWPDPGPDGLMRMVPFYVGKLSESEVQDVLRSALGEGGLGVARSEYVQGGIADAPSTFFTVKAGGVDKTVAVNALGFDPQEAGPDAAIRKAFAALAGRLNELAAALAAADQPYAPERWRAVLMDAGMGAANPPIAWPWPELSPKDFAQGDPSGIPFANRTLTADQVAALGLGDIGGGLQGAAILGPDGSSGYTLALRPLFPDEER